MKYKGGELQKLQEQGVHIVVVNKKASADEIKDARASCDAPQLKGVSATTTAEPVPASQSTPNQK